jgi:hypothetical protein
VASDSAKGDFFMGDSALGYPAVILTNREWGKIFNIMVFSKFLIVLNS